MEQYGTINISLKPLIFNEFIGCFAKKKTPFPHGHGPDPDGPRRTQTDPDPRSLASPATTLAPWVTASHRDHLMNFLRHGAWW